MANPNESEQLKLVNSLVVDMGVLEGRITQMLHDLASSSGHDSQLRISAVETLRQSVLAATTRLRQEGQHPDSQGRLLRQERCQGSPIYPNSMHGVEFREKQCEISPQVKSEGRIHEASNDHKHVVRDFGSLDSVHTN